MLFILLFSFGLSAQDRTIDSLKLALKNAKHDTTRCDILLELTNVVNYEEWQIYFTQLLELAELNIQKTDISPFLKKKYSNYKGEALNGIGYIYDNEGDIQKALECYHRSLKIYEEIKDLDGIALSLNNIGYIYDIQKDYSKSLEYYYRSLKIYTETSDKVGIALAFNNIGVVCQKQGDILKAKDCFQKSLRIHEEIKHERGISRSSMNLGFIYNKQGNYAKALEYYNRSLKIQEGNNDREGMAYSTSYISNALFMSGELNEAFKYATRSLNISKELGFPENMMRASVILKDIYKKQNKFKEALKMYELEIQMRDSINNTETKKASIKKQFQYEYEKKAAADSVKNAEEQKVKNALLKAQQAQLKQEKTQRLALYTGLVLVIAFSGFVFNRFKITQKQKVIIEQQKVLVDTAFLQLEEKNKEVLDSIHYAKRIQTALLTSEKYIERKLNELNSRSN